MQNIFILLSLLLLLLISEEIYCQTSNLRLSGGSGPHEGNVEVYLKNEWRHICDDYWDIRDAKVVCRQLGFTKALKATTKSEFKVSLNASYWYDNVQCWGSETNIDYCFNRGRGRHNCKHQVEAAGVICMNVTENQQLAPIPSKTSGKSGAIVKLKLSGESKDGFVSSGYLQVELNNTWGYICADKWSKENSYVACGNLGYPGIETKHFIAKKETTAEHWLYHMKHVHCTGLESALYECEHKGFQQHKCSSKEAVYLNCERSPFLKNSRFDTVSLASHVIRLRAGSRHSEGRVEVKHMERWGSICDDQWNIKNANVFCRQMGFGTAFQATHHASFGEGSGKVWLDEVSCTGVEKDIRNCSHLDWGEGDCGHKEDAGVKCHFPYTEHIKPIRLTGGPKPWIGRVEVFDDNNWRSVCGIGWGVREAEVVCRQAGLGYGRRGWRTSNYGLPDDRVLAYYAVKCSGDELALHHCYHKTQKSGGRCRYYDMAVVECSSTAPDLVMDYRELKKSIQLESKPLYELSCANEENCLATSAAYYMHYPELFNRRLLRFTSRYWNRGTANFRPDVKKDRWEWHQCHRHYHSMERFTDYDLIDEKNIKKAEGHKASFCLEDSKCEKGVSKFFNCTDRGDQGISVGCADNYKFNIDCQWIDVTDVSNGRYTLRIIINPQRNVIESDYSNNIVSCDIHMLSDTKVNVTSCAIEPCEQLSHSGTADGGCCIFPFVFKGKQYHHCTTDGFKSKKTLWCATTNNYDKDQLWGLC